MKKLIKKILSEDNTPQPGVSSSKGTDVSNMTPNTKYLNINEKKLSFRTIQLRMDFPHDTRNSYGWNSAEYFSRKNTF